MPEADDQLPILYEDPGLTDDPTMPSEEEHLASTSLTAELGETARSRRALPAAPHTRNRPRTQSGPIAQGTGATPPTRFEDPELWQVADELHRLDPDGIRFAAVLREAFDQIYDGQRTGRWDYSQLMKTEKTHIGTLIEIWLQREFRFLGGQDLDYAILGVEVDAKWSRNLYDWEIPMEMYQDGDELALLVWANEYTSRWAAGMLRISERVLLPEGRQRDRKRKLNAVGRDEILWIFRDHPMIENTLLHIDPAVALRIAAAPSGQAAIDTLFREVQHQLINRASIITAAQQIDHGKRVRDARRNLMPAGIIILGHYHPHPEIAGRLGLPVPSLGRFVSARVTPEKEPPAQMATIGGTHWRLAWGDDPVVEAPKLPKQGRTQGDWRPSAAR